MSTVPERSEAAEYYFTYIDRVPAGDVRALFDAQGTEVQTLLGGIPDQNSPASLRARQVEHP